MLLSGRAPAGSGSASFFHDGRGGKAEFLHTKVCDVAHSRKQKCTMTLASLALLGTAGQARHHAMLVVCACHRVVSDAEATSSSQLLQLVHGLGLDLAHALPGDIVPAHQVRHQDNTHELHTAGTSFHLMMEEAHAVHTTHILPSTFCMAWPTSLPLKGAACSWGAPKGIQTRRGHLCAVCFFKTLPTLFDPLARWRGLSS